MAYDTLEKSRLIIKILATFGVLTNEKLQKISPIYFKLIIHLPLTFTITTLMWIEILTSTDLNEACDVLYIALTETAFVVKLLSIWYHDTLIKSLLNEWQHNDMFQLQTTHECVMWRNTIKLYSIVAFLYITCSLTDVGCAFTAVLFLERYQLPFPCWLPFNWKDPIKYWNAYIYELISLPVTCISNCTMDMFLCYMMQHLALYFKLLAMRLERLDIGKDTTNAGITKRLLAIIEFHVKLKRMSKSCEIIVSYPILTQIVLSAFILCFSLYRLQNSNILEDPIIFLSLLQFAVSMTLQIYLPCYYANQLTVESSRLMESIYNCNWPVMSKYNRRLILLYMQYLQDPVILKAGNFFNVGLPIFSKTMNNAYSFFALLLNMDVD